MSLPRVEFLGLDTRAEVVTLDGGTRTVRAVYLDAAATALAPKAVEAVRREYLERSCANAHTTASAPGRATTAAIADARARVGAFVAADPSTHVVCFVGNGATGALNRIAAALFRGPAASGRDVAVVSAQEHHSNQLPWLRGQRAGRVEYAPIRDDGTLDLGALRTLLRKHGRRVRVVAVTAVSNVTGAVNDTQAIAALAHEVGAECVVDAAQAVAHVPFAMGTIDHVAFSGHKLYAPGSPGVLVARRSAFPAGAPVGDVGGGCAARVAIGEPVAYAATPSAREEAGTPNIPGIVALGAAVALVERVGRENIAAHEHALLERCEAGLRQVPGVVLYGPSEGPRAGVVPFNVASLPHGVLGAALSDYHGIAVRNECFCAQPFVRAQLAAVCDATGEHGPCTVEGQAVRGMVRASFGMWTTTADVDALVRAVADLAAHAPRVLASYEQDAAGEYAHRTFRGAAPFDLGTSVARHVGR